MSYPSHTGGRWKRWDLSPGPSACRVHALACMPLEGLVCPPPPIPMRAAGLSSSWPSCGNLCNVRDLHGIPGDTPHCPEVFKLIRGWSFQSVSVTMKLQLEHSPDRLLSLAFKASQGLTPTHHFTAFLPCPKLLYWLRR